MQLFTRLADLCSFTRVAEYADTSKLMVSKELVTFKVTSF